VRGLIRFVGQAKQGLHRRGPNRSAHVNRIGGRALHFREEPRNGEVAPAIDDDAHRSFIRIVLHDDNDRFSEIRI
jgi:hypothetical protein